MWARRVWRRGCSSASGSCWRPLTPAERHNSLLTALQNGWLGRSMGVGQQRELLSDLAGRFLHACMTKFSRSLLQCHPQVILSPLASRIHRPSWYETPSSLANLEAFLLLNKMRPQPIFPPADLEALIAAYLMQEPSTMYNCIEGSMLTMAVSVHSMCPHSRGAYGTAPNMHSVDVPLKGLVFTEHEPWCLNKKLLLALFRILFKREVEDVVAQYQQGCVDALCTIFMRRIGTRALPPLLKLYVDQLFGCSHKTRERAAEGLKDLLKLHTEGHL